MSRVFIPVLILLGIFMSASGATAQEAPADLRQMKRQVRHSLLTALLPEKKRFQSELLDLEKKLATASDFAGAIRARDERMAMEQEIAAIERELSSTSSTGVRLPDELKLALEDARCSELTFDVDQKAITNWHKPQAVVKWTLPSLPTGGYEVHLRYTSASSAVIQAKEGFYQLQGTLPISKEPVEANLGTLRIREGSGDLTMTVVVPYEESYDLKLYAVTLRPAAAD